MKDREDLGDFPRLASRSKAAPVTVEAQQKGPTTFYHLQGEGGLQPQGITLSSSTLIRCLELKTRNFNPILDPFYEKLQDKAEKVDVSIQRAFLTFFVG